MLSCTSYIPDFKNCCCRFQQAWEKLVVEQVRFARFGKLTIVLRTFREQGYASCVQMLSVPKQSWQWRKCASGQDICMSGRKGFDSRTVDMRVQAECSARFAQERSFAQVRFDKRNFQLRLKFFCKDCNNNSGEAAARADVEPEFGIGRSVRKKLR